MLMEAIADQILATDNNFPEVSIIMPCLNEADTLAACIGKARRALNEQKIAGEIIVADNGSTDGSLAIATKLGARLINVREKGYGSALMGGIRQPEGNISSWAMPMTAMIFWRLQSSWKNFAKDSISSKGAGSFWWRCRKTRRHAVSSSSMGQSDVFLSRSVVVQITPARCVLWAAGFQKRCLLFTRSALYGHGICHGNDHQGESIRSENYRGPDYTASRRAKGSCSSSPDLP